MSHLVIRQSEAPWGTGAYVSVVRVVMASMLRNMFRLGVSAALSVGLVACRGHDAVVLSDSPARSPETTSASELAMEAALDSVAAPNVFVNVTNQSYDDPDVQVTITVDGEPFVDESFPVRGQHHVVGFELLLASGEHRLVATSDTGAEHEILVVVSDGPVYVHVGYWASEDEEPHFDTLVSAEPFAYG